MYRLQDNVPEYLINESRDFQILCRLYDCLNNGVKFSIDSIVRVMNTTTCGSSFLKLLESRLGFFTDGQYTDTEVRDVLFGFCDMVKYKGSKLGIARAVRTFLIAKNLKVSTRVDYDPKERKIGIGIKAKEVDTSLLEDILRYVMPAGCLVDYYYYAEEKKRTDLEVGNRVVWILSKDKIASNLVNSSSYFTDKYSVATMNGSGGYNTSYTPTDAENTSINRTLANVGFINMYSKGTDTATDNASIPDITVETVINTVKKDNGIVNNSSSGE